MIDGSEKSNRQLAFELQNSHLCEKCSNYRLRMNLKSKVPKTIGNLTSMVKTKPKGRKMF